MSSARERIDAGLETNANRFPRTLSGILRSAFSSSRASRDSWNGISLHSFARISSSVTRRWPKLTVSFWLNRLSFGNRYDKFTRDE